MAELIRDTPIGQIIRFLSSNRYLQYPEEKPNFQLPQEWLDILNESSDDNQAPVTSYNEDSSSPGGPEPAHGNLSGIVESQSRHETEPSMNNLEKVHSTPITPRKTKDGTILVDWYLTDDAAKPHNLTSRRRFAVATIISL